MLSWCSQTLASSPYVLTTLPSEGIFAPYFWVALTDTPTHWIPTSVINKLEVLTLTCSGLAWCIFFGYPWPSVFFCCLVQTFVWRLYKNTCVTPQLKRSIGVRPSVGFLIAARLEPPCFFVWRETSQRCSALFLSGDSNRSWYLFFPLFLKSGIYKSIIKVEQLVINQSVSNYILFCQIVVFLRAVLPTAMGLVVRCYIQSKTYKKNRPILKRWIY